MSYIFLSIIMHLILTVQCSSYVKFITRMVICIKIACWIAECGETMLQGPCVPLGRIRWAFLFLLTVFTLLNMFIPHLFSFIHSFKYGAGQVTAGEHSKFLLPIALLLRYSAFLLPSPSSPSQDFVPCVSQARWETAAELIICHSVQAAGVDGVGSFLLIRTVAVLVLILLAPHSRNEKADTALPVVLESNDELHTAAPVMPDKELDTELDRYGARNC